MTIRLKDKESVDIITSAQTVTASWADMGEEVDMRDFGKVALWVDIDINGSNDVRFRVLGKKGAAATDEFQIADLYTSASGLVPVNGKYYEVGTDSDQQLMIPIVFDAQVPFLQFQVIAATLGSPAAIIKTASVTCQR